MAVGTLWSVTLDCSDPRPLARFWAAMLDGTIEYDTDDFVGVSTPRGVWIGAYRVDDHVAPQWPEGGQPKQFHLDLSVDDLDRAEAAAIELGAVKAGHQQRPGSWRVLLDPAGHPFCITTTGT